MFRPYHPSVPALRNIRFISSPVPRFGLPPDKSAWFFARRAPMAAAAWRWQWTRSAGNQPLGKLVIGDVRISKKAVDQKYARVAKRVLLIEKTCTAPRVPEVPGSIPEVYPQAIFISFSSYTGSYPLLRTPSSVFANVAPRRLRAFDADKLHLFVVIS